MVTCILVTFWLKIDPHHLWGRTTWEARRLVCDEHKARVTDRRYLGNIATLLIGPAGENLCMASCIIAGLSRAAAKTGMGAVWGSKNLKGVAVRGSKGINVARPAEFLLLCEKLWLRLKDDPLYETHSKYGPLSWVGSAFSRSPAGSKVLSGGKRNESVEEAALEPFFERNLACFACPMHCGHFFNVKEGKYKGTKGEGPEATLQLFAMGLGTSNTGFLFRYYNMCSQLGLNLEAPAAAINWAMNLWEAGIITKEDTDGLEVTRGDEDVILELLRKVAYKEGFGELLDGYPVGAVQRLGRGSEKYASHTKGLPTYNFTSGIGTNLSYTVALNVNTRGFDTGPAAYVYSPDLRDEWGINNELLTKLGQERYGDPDIFTRPWLANRLRAQVVCDLENMGAIADMTGICTFATQIALCLSGMSMQDFAELLAVATGIDISTQDLVQAAERKVLLERAYNARQGIRRRDEYPFFLRWQLERGERHPLFDYEKTPVDLESYNLVLEEYYRLSGCDPSTGIPARTKLEKLGLTDVADDLKIRRISLV